MEHGNRLQLIFDAGGTADATTDSSSPPPLVRTYSGC